MKDDQAALLAAAILIASRSSGHESIGVQEMAVYELAHRLLVWLETE